MSDEIQVEGEELPHLLLVDDDATFTRVMARAMARRGFRVSTAGSAEEGLTIAQADLPDYAALDLKMDGDSGLVLLPKLLELDAETIYRQLAQRARETFVGEKLKLVGVHTGGVWLAERLKRERRSQLQEEIAALEQRYGIDAAFDQGTKDRGILSARVIRGRQQQGVALGCQRGFQRLHPLPQRLHIRVVDLQRLQLAGQLLEVMPVAAQRAAGGGQVTVGWQPAKIHCRP